MNGTHLSGHLPWTRSCFVCGQDNPRGFQLRSRLEDGRVVLEYRTKPTDVGYKHTVHGGILMTLLDEVMTWSAILASHGVCVAAEMTTRLKAPVETGRTLRVEGWITRHTRRLNLTEGRVLDDLGNLIAEASGKYMPVELEAGKLQADDFVQAEGVLSAEQILRSQRSEIRGQ
jgi:uncharacterized protein (TIGR00369 family)